MAYSNRNVVLELDFLLIMHHAKTGGELWTAIGCFFASFGIFWAAALRNRKEILQGTLAAGIFEQIPPAVCCPQYASAAISVPLRGERNWFDDCDARDAPARAESNEGCRVE
jgi:hypothetical protein